MYNIDQTLSFVETLPYMAKGMAGIFLVILVIMAAIKILDVCTREKKDPKAIADSSSQDDGD